VRVEYLLIRNPPGPTVHVLFIFRASNNDYDGYFPLAYYVEEHAVVLLRGDSDPSHDKHEEADAVGQFKLACKMRPYTALTAVVGGVVPLDPSFKRPTVSKTLTAMPLIVFQ
jgi:hypothetical protein